MSLLKVLPTHVSVGSRVVASSQTTARALLLLAAAVVLFRLPTLDFSYLNYDEAAYILVASAWKHGLLPYVDVVDRKPLGIFVIYGFAESLFRSGVVGPRIFGAAATFATSALLFLFARRFLATSLAGALSGASLFAAYGLLFGGDAAQAPVFYMPLIAVAVFGVAEALERLASDQAAGAARLGAAGLLLGLALQIKYSVIFECVGLGGIVVLCGAVRWNRLQPEVRRDLILGIGLMMAGGLLPTLIAGGAYVALGHFDSWFFYNFTSNLQREASDYPVTMIARNAAQFALCGLPLAALAAGYVYDRQGRLPSLPRWGAQAWIHLAGAVWFASALAGGLALRQPYSHYFYGLIAPLAMYAGAALDHPGTSVLKAKGLQIVGALLAFAGLIYAGGWSYEISTNGSPYLTYRMAETLRSENPRSLYVVNHFGILYYLAGQPLPTKYPMPGHLLRDIEAHSYGFDGAAEMSRVLAERPEMVVVSRPLWETTAPDRLAILDAALKDGYCTWRTYDAGQHTVTIYRDQGYTSGGPSDDCAD